MPPGTWRFSERLSAKGLSWSPSSCAVVWANCLGRKRATRKKLPKSKCFISDSPELGSFFLKVCSLRVYYFPVSRKINTTLSLKEKILATRKALTSPRKKKIRL